MKNVNKGNSIDKFIGLKSKMDCMLLDKCKEFNTGKGVNRI